MADFCDTSFLIGIPYACDALSVPFVKSLIELERPRLHKITFVGHTITAAARNACAQQALREHFDYLMFLDSDMTFPPGIIQALWSNQVDIVSAIYRTRRGGEVIAHVFDEGWNRCFPIRTFDLSGRLVPVDCVGTGALLIRSTVFRALAPPWFYYGPAHCDLPEDQIKIEHISAYADELSLCMDHNYGYQHGEDFQFCINCRRAGIAIYVDSAVSCGHVGTKVIGRAAIEPCSIDTMEANDAEP